MSINYHLYTMHLEADKPFLFVVQIWCVSFPFSAEMQGSMQDSSFVHLTIYPPFRKELYPTFNFNISKVLSPFYFLFPVLLGYQKFNWIAIVNAFAVKRFN